MSIAHGEVLYAIAEGHTTARTAAADLVVSESTVRRRLVDLVVRGWVTRQADGTWALTASGRTAHAEGAHW